MIVPIVQIAVLLILFVSSAFFSSAETAFFTLTYIDIENIKHKNRRVALKIEHLLRKPTKLLSSILIGNTIVNVLVAAVGNNLFKYFLGEKGSLFTILVITGFLVVFGEVTPKRIAMIIPKKLACLYAKPLAFCLVVLTPIRYILENICKFARPTDEDEESLTENEFLFAIESSKEHGVLDEEEREMVDGIISMEEMQASDIMTPRVDIIGIDLDDTPEQHSQIASNVKFRYLPVYRDSLDNPVGFLNVIKYLLSPELKVEDAMISPFHVPETISLDTLLRTFQRNKKRAAYVTDEYGGAAGLVTRGDVLEEIVDDVENEYDNNTQYPMQQIDDNTWLIIGDTSLEEINRDLSLELEADGADRIAGWFIAQTKHMPRTGETIESQGCRVTTQRVRKHRITLLRLEVLPHEEDASETEEDKR
ncbi:MAG: hemolysin family protein [Kiritimatiellae bacterium]|jgi:putative hemolysin|nr:hemolysin family protein [Kiritimatiellia bacterium]